MKHTELNFGLALSHNSKLYIEKIPGGKKKDNDMFRTHDEKFFIRKYNCLVILWNPLWFKAGVGNYFKFKHQCNKF